MSFLHWYSYEYVAERDIDTLRRGLARRYYLYGMAWAVDPQGRMLVWEKREGGYELGDTSEEAHPRCAVSPATLRTILEDAVNS